MAAKPEYVAKLAELCAHVPKTFSPLVEPRISSLFALDWHADEVKPVPPSKPDGNPFNVFFVNQREDPVELFWMDCEGKPKSYGTIGTGKTKTQQTRPGAVWQIKTRSGKPLGHFKVSDRPAQAVIPAN